MNFSGEKILVLLEKIIIFAIIFFVPLFFLAFFNTNNIFELAKMVLFRIFIMLLFIVYLCNLALKKEIKFVSIKNFSSDCLILASLLLVLFAHTLVFSINPYNSFFGLYDRQQGLISLAYYFLFFYLLIRIVKKEQINHILLTVFASSLFVSLYGVMQRFGWDFMTWTEAPSVTHRIFSSLGQPTFLANYLILIIPISFYLFFISNSRFLNILYFFGFILQATTIGLTNSFSSFLVLFFEILAIYLFIFLISRKKEKKESSFLKRKIIISGICLLFLAFSTLIYGYRNDWAVSNKIQNILKWQSSSGQVRVLYWKASWEAIKERPFFGYGLENQGEILIKYYNKSWAELELVNMTTNRAHNLLLDILLTSGAFGLFLFFSIFFYLSLIVFENYRKRDDLLSVFLFLAIVFLFLALQFSFVAVVAGVYLGLFCSIIFVVKNDKKIVVETNRNVLLKKIPAKVLLCSAPFAIIFCVFFIIFNFNKIVADQYFRSLLEANQAGGFLAQISLYDLIKENKFSDKFYDQQFVLIMNDLLKDTADRKKLVLEIKDRVSKIAKETNDNTFSGKLNRARSYGILAVYDKSYYSEANKYYNDLIAISPGYPLIYDELASLGRLQADYQTATSNYEHFLNGLPKLDSPLMNDAHKKAVAEERMKGLNGLGDTYSELNKWDEAKKYYDQVLAINNNRPSVYYKISRLYFKQSNYNQAIWYNEKASQLDPANYFYPYVTAKYYEASGEKEMALEFAEKSLKLDPNSKIVSDLIKKLK